MFMKAISIPKITPCSGYIGVYDVREKQIRTHLKLRTV